jgi:hypothetical protein
MVPYSCLNHDDIINIIISSCSDYVDYSHYRFLISKYSSADIYSYQKICLYNCRSWPVIFIST